MSERLAHYVNPAPFDPDRIEKMTPEMERYYMASQWPQDSRCGVGGAKDSGRA